MAEGFEENVEFLELNYLDTDDVELDLAFESIAPLLWLRAGAPVRSSIVAAMTPARPSRSTSTDRYGVLFDPDHWRAFVEKLPESATTVFIVTDSAVHVRAVAAELPSGRRHRAAVRELPVDFAINRGR